MAKLLPAAYTGAVLQLLVERFYMLQYWCGGIALIHLVVEWLYTGRPIPRFTLGLLVCLLMVTAVGGVWIQPKMTSWYGVKYGRYSTPAQRQMASQALQTADSIVRVVNVAVLAGLLAYLWRIDKPSTPLRFVSTPKFQG